MIDAIVRAHQNERRTIVTFLRRAGRRDFDGANALLAVADEIEGWPDPADEHRCVGCGRVAMIVYGRLCAPCADEEDRS